MSKIILGAVHSIRFRKLDNWGIDCDCPYIHKYNLQMIDFSIVLLFIKHDNNIKI